MRFCVELLINNPIIPKEKNKMIMHIIKLLFENTNKSMYEKLYEKENNREKDFTFSTYLGKNVKFNKDTISIPDKKIILNFSTYNPKEGILFYNSFVQNIGLEIPIKKNLITINNISQGHMGYIEENTIFKTSSPIVVREHKNDNKKTWYHNLNTKEGYDIFINNLKWQLKSNLSSIKSEDIDEIDIDILSNKIVNIKHYGITIPSNLAIIKIRAKYYIIDYLYNSGIGSRRSQGFGYLDIK